jgi:hypothetical protein
MDIEGHEEVFLRSAAFKEWLVRNQVNLVVELHRPEFWDLVWKELPSRHLQDNRVLIGPAAKETA